VVIPSFVCPLVPLAIKRAGLKTLVCDIQKDGFDFAAQELNCLCRENNDILAITAVHLGGIPADIDAIKQACAEKGIFIIEDCAQSLGALYKGNRAGALADFSFFSLCRGKGLTIYEGGVAVCNRQEYAQALEETIGRLAGKNFLSEALKIAELFGYWIFYRPQLAWFIFALPQIFWQMRGMPLKAAAEDYEENFPLCRVSAFRKSCGRRAMRRMQNELAKQRANALYYRQKLKGIPTVKLIAEAPGDMASYPYLTVIFDGEEQRDKALRALSRKGLGASRIYLKAITDYPYLQGLDGAAAPLNARYLAEHHLSLSTSAFLRQEEIAQACALIKGL
jgi:dTDP-4-amino-4,6-dideoxygalactose transaminase